MLTARRHRTALVAAALAAVVALVLTATGTVQMPNLGHALEDLSDTLGAWTYALVGGLAFLETGAFVGLLAPGETAIVLGGVVAAEGGVDLLPILLVAWVFAALGDLASFVLGQRLGRRFLHRHGPRVGMTEPRLHRVERFYEKHGAEGDPRRAVRRARPRRLPLPGRLLRAQAPRRSCPGASSARRCGRPRSRSSATASTSRSARPRAR